MQGPAAISGLPGSYRHEADGLHAGFPMPWA